MNIPKCMFLGISILFAAVFGCNRNSAPSEQVMIDMKGDYRTCGGHCSSFTHNTTSDELSCPVTKECTDNVGCSCHLYGELKAGDAQKEWEHIWKPGDTKPLKAMLDQKYKAYHCVCVKPKG